ncbi:MAG: hypothetical protein JSV35_08275 [Candidatus Bathyarchaeota archaeon]|nr:MAG: hypothetical protein JSV35_08275 [Candidatus Bathyarchaeota archaeon]
MKRKLALISFTFILFSSLLNVAITVRDVQANDSIGIKPAASLSLQTDMPVVHVDPQVVYANPGENFTISVKVFNLSDNFYATDEPWEQGEPLGPPGSRFNYSLGGLYAVDIQLAWDPAIIDYVEHTVTMPVEDYPDGILHEPLLDVVDEVDSTNGTYDVAKASWLTAGAFNRPDENATVFNMTFTVLASGVSNLSITKSDLAIPALPEYSGANAEIPHWRIDGSLITSTVATVIESVEVKAFDNATGFVLPVISGESALVNTTILNEGDSTDFFNLTLHWGPTLLDSWVNETLGAGERKTYNYTINEMELTVGNHTITAAISVLHDSSISTDEIETQFQVIGTPTLSILGPVSGELGDTLVYTSNSTHTDPDGTIVSYIWRLWAPGETLPRIEQVSENASFEISLDWITGSWIVTLDVEDNYGITYDEGRPATGAWHAEEAVEIIPEFQWLIMLLLFTIATASTALMYKGRRGK